MRFSTAKFGAAKRRTATTSALIGALAASLLIAPAAATAAPQAPQRAEGDAASCEVTGGTLKWGLKESFRAYISGSIANGEWKTSDGATYETPNFIWDDATGEIDPATGDGSVSFTGKVRFTGHEGILDLVIANPTIEFEDGKGSLLLDAKSNDMEGELAVDAKQQWAGDITLEDGVQVADEALTLDQAPVKLTNEGAKAFAGFYEAGVELDPIDLDVQLAGCDAAAAAPADEASEDPAPAETAAPAATEQQIPWLPIGIGAAALLVIGITVGVLIGGRKKKPAAGAAASAGASGAVQDPAVQDPPAQAPASENGGWQ